MVGAWVASQETNNQSIGGEAHLLRYACICICRVMIIRAPMVAVRRRGGSGWCVRTYKNETMAARLGRWRQAWRSQKTFIFYSETFFLLLTDKHRIPVVVIGQGASQEQAHQPHCAHKGHPTEPYCTTMAANIYIA